MGAYNIFLSSASSCTNLLKSSGKLFDSSFIKRVGFIAISPENQLLPIGGHSGQLIGGGFSQLGLLPGCPPALGQVLPDHLEPGQLGGAGVDRFGHMVPHPAGKLIALFLQLVQELLHLQSLFAQFCRRQSTGIGVGVDQTQLLQGRRSGRSFDNAGDFTPAVRIILGQQLHGGTAAMTRHDHVTTGGVRMLPDSDGLLQSAH